MPPSRTKLHATLDFFVTSLLLAGANFLLAKQDPGWMHLNPTPWILPGALLGIRYGFTAGLMCGILTAAGIAAIHSYLSGQPVPELLHERAYYFLSIVLLGALAGQAGTHLASAQRKAATSTEKLGDENKRLRTQLQLIDETRYQLQQRLALTNAPMASLQEELAKLFSFPPSEFNQQLLALLHRLTGLTSAGIYAVKGRSLQRGAVIHPTEPLAPALSLTDTPLAAEALSSQALASVPDATDLTQAQPFLAAFPWVDHSGSTSVLLIHDMPLEAYTWRNLARLDLILSWSSALAALRQSFAASGKGSRTLDGQEFQILVQEAADADRVHHLPSALLVVHHQGHEAGAVLKQLSDTSVATVLSPGRTLAILLPFAGEAEAAALAYAIAGAQPGTKFMSYMVTAEVDAAAVWNSLQQA